MKKRLMEFLCCADCRCENLDLRPYEVDGNGEAQRILEGEIRCRQCDSRFPVIRGIPRMLPLSLRPHLIGLHRDFFDRHPGLIPAGAAEAADTDVAQTLLGYTYQYSKLSDPQRETERWKENFRSSIPVSLEFFSGKIGVDIGCGNGRHLYWAHEFGAEMVGLELSEGVELARANTADCPRSHVVQGDIYHLPFKKSVFDFAYSIGVLHHLPDPREGFHRVLPSLRPKGRIFFWVYGLRDMRLWYRLSHMTWLRRITSLLPRSVQHGISIVLALLLEALLWTPCRLLFSLPGGSSLVRRIPLGDSARRTFQFKVRSVFDRIQPPVTHYHNTEELEEWLKEAGLSQTLVCNRDGRGLIAAGVKG